MNFLRGKKKTLLLQVLRCLWIAREDSRDQLFEKYRSVSVS